MKTKIYFLGLIFNLICYFGNTQAYNPLVLENAQWKVIQDNDATPWIDFQGGWLIRGDTSIDGVAYKKLFERAFEEPYSNVITNQWLYGFLREDTLNKTVYIIESPPGSYGCDSADQEYLLFDFSYEVGDASRMCLHTEQIESYLIDTGLLYIYGYNRKIFQFSGGSSAFIEGIGHESGLLESPVISMSGGPYYYLEEYCLGTDEECNVVYVKIDEMEQVSHYRIYPNPCRGYFYIKGMTDINENIHYSVNDVIGKEVVSGETPANSEFQITLDETGIFIVRLWKQGEVPLTYKVVNY